MLIVTSPGKAWSNRHNSTGPLGTLTSCSLDFSNTDATEATDVESYINMRKPIDEDLKRESLIGVMERPNNLS